MNPIDLLVVGAVVFAAVSGIRAGFIATLYGLVSWIVSLIAAFALLSHVATLIDGLELVPEPASRAIAFVLVLLGAEAVFSLVGRFAIWPMVKVVHAFGPLAALDRLLGIIPSVLRMIVVLAVGLAALVVLPVGNDVRAAIDGSRFGRALVAEMAAIQPYIGELIGAEGGGLFVTRIDADQRAELDLPEGLVLEIDAVAEAQMVELVNEERRARGLVELVIDERLVEVARAHSREMFELGYFSHQSPNTGSPFDRMTNAGIEYQRAGENLAYAQSVAVAHRGLMDSPGHRENILRPEFTRIGVGVIAAGAYGRMFTQLFIRP